MKPYRLVIFDWEGTLSDTLGNFLHSIIFAASRFAAPPVLDPTIFRACVGLNLEHSIQKLYPNITLNQQERLLLLVQQSLWTAKAKVFLMCGAKLLLEHLDQQKILLAIASNKSLRSLQEVLQQSEVAHFFAAIRSASQTNLKPHPQMLLELLEELNILPHEALMIGDSPVDMEMAKSVQIDTIGFDFYQKNTQELLNSGAIAVFDQYQDIETWLGTLTK